MKSFRLSRIVPMVFVLLIATGLGSVLAQDNTATPPPTSATPTAKPTETAAPATTAEPTAEPTEEITAEPTEEATVEPTEEPTEEPTPPIIIDGAVPMQPLLAKLAENYPHITIETNGPNTAFTRLCSGEIQIVMSNRFITDEELAACQTVSFIENALGYEAMVALVSPTIDPAITCTSIDQLDQLYGIGAEGTEANVVALDFNAQPAPITLYASFKDSIAAILPSGEIRPDTTFFETPEEALTLLSENQGVALMTYADYATLTDLKGARALQFRDPISQICFDPTVANFESRSYSAVQPLMLYVNVLKATDDFLTFINSENGARVAAAELGLTPASDLTYSRNLSNLTTLATGRTYSRPTVPPSLTAAATGIVNLQGGSLGAPLLTPLKTSLTANYPGVTVNAQLYGDDAAWTALCNGSADVIISDATPTPEQLQACTAAGIEWIEAPVGSEAAVFVTSAQKTDLPVCLTLDQAVNIFAEPVPTQDETVPTEDENTANAGPTNWNQIDPSFPDMPLLLLVPARSDYLTDWLFAAAGQNTRFVRSDDEDSVIYNSGETNPGLYRATAVANYNGGGITILSWYDYQQSEAKDRLRLLAVDNGSGCIDPSEATINDGTYPLSVDFTLYFSKKALSNPAVSAFLWNTLSDSTLSSLKDLNLAVFNQDGLIALRNTAFDLIEAAKPAAETVPPIFASPGAPPTIEPTVESTPDSTAESTPEATVEVTPEVTAETTPESTVEATAESGN